MRLDLFDFGEDAGVVIPDPADIQEGLELGALRRVMVVVAAFIGVIVVVLGGEILLARGGAHLDEFDVTSLNESL